MTTRRPLPDDPGEFIEPDEAYDPDPVGFKTWADEQEDGREPWDATTVAIVVGFAFLALAVVAAVWTVLS